MTRQDKILQIVAKHDTASLETIYNECDWSYYHNWAKHLGAILSTMVKNGKLNRVKRGVFKLADHKPVNQKIIDKSQIQLF
jgi:DeoR/GlpR family transcriptional regulator of sugar metabolism